MGGATVHVMTGGEAGLRARELLVVGCPAEALELVAPFLAGDDPGPHTVAIVAMLELDRPAEAAEAAGAALGRFGPVPDVARVASYALRAAGEPEQAVEVARAGARQAPQWVPGLLALVEAELAIGQRVDERLLDTVIELAPERADVRLVAADAALAAGQRKRAREHCLAALAIDPEETSAMAGLGRIDEARHRVGGAARWYARALQLRPDDFQLANRVRALFGRLLGSVMVALMLAAFVSFVAFMAHADPAPGQRDPYDLPDAVFWALWVVVFGGAVGFAVWSALRGAPRVVLRALVSEGRVYRSVRRCVRLTVASATVVVATALAAVVPVGMPPDRLPVVLALWLAAMILLIVLAVLLRRTFGFGQFRAATADPYDEAEF